MSKPSGIVGTQIDVGGEAVENTAYIECLEGSLHLETTSILYFRKG